jgi:hypothetical protein
MNILSQAAINLGHMLTLPMQCFVQLEMASEVHLAVFASHSVPAISASGLKHKQPIPKLVEQIHNFQKEYNFYKFWVARHEKTAYCQENLASVVTWQE